MSASQQARDHAVAKAARVLALIKQAAAIGSECPTNAVLAERVGYQTTSAVVRALDFLVAAGTIQIERRHMSRVVTICATGQKTAGTVMHRPSPPKRNYVRSVEVFGEPKFVDRHTCWKCGTRSDVGCKHVVAA